MNANELSLFFQNNYTAEERLAPAYRYNVLAYFEKVVTSGGDRLKKGYVVDITKKGEIFSRQVLLDLSFQITEDNGNLHYSLATGKEYRDIIINLTPGASFFEYEDPTMGKALRISDEGFTSHYEITIYFSGILNLAKKTSDGGIVFKVEDEDGKEMENTSFVVFGPNITPRDYPFSSLVIKQPSSKHPAWDYGMYSGRVEDGYDGPKLTIAFKDGESATLARYTIHEPTARSSVKQFYDEDGVLINEIFDGQILFWGTDYVTMSGCVDCIKFADWEEGWEEAFPIKPNEYLELVSSRVEGEYDYAQYRAHFSGIRVEKYTKIKKPTAVEIEERKEVSPITPTPKKRKRFLWIF